MIFAKTLKLIPSKIFFVVGIPFIIYFIHILLFGDWIIDDAGIAFSYSRNFAQGYGLVSQPGLEPVEGFSSYTWIFLFTPFFRLNIFHPVYVPKLISILFVLLSFITLFKIIRQMSSVPIILTFICLALLSLNTSFVVWTSSGLENPLYVFLTLLLLYQLIELGRNMKLKTAILTAICTALLAMTRPEGILFFFVPLIILLFDIFLRKESPQETVFNLLVYASVFILLFGSFFLLKLNYYNDFFPNTYYSKGGPSYQDFIDLVLLHPKTYSRIYELFESIFPVFGIFVLTALLIITVYLIYLKNFTKQHFALLLVLFFSAAIYVLLPPDWMGELRFATTFYPLLYAYLFLISEKIIQKIEWRNSTKYLSAALIIIFLGPSVIDFAERTNEFRKKPTVPFLMVEQKYAKTFDNYASILNIKNGSLLLPDIGGTLFYSKLRIIDLGGLVDKTIAKTLLKNQKDFYDYIFETIKPTFIHTHGVWGYRADFDSDRRFRQEYVPINEQIDTRMTKKYNGQKIYLGDYVRKDAVNAELLQKVIQLSKNSEQLVHIQN
ncbi:MAG: hypothetical protein ACM34O_02285 [Ignavibacteria bacterium]